VIDTVDFGVLSAVNEAGLEVAYVSLGYTNFLCLCGISISFIWVAVLCGSVWRKAMSKSDPTFPNDFE
jgi:hypothetical protein